MKKILILAALLCAGFAHAQETRLQAESSLMGLGMPAALATEVSGLTTGLGIISNNTYLKFRNNANSANLDVLRADTSDAIRLNANTTLNLAIGGSAIAKVTSAGFAPTTDGDNTSANLGSGSLGFKNIYLSDATARAQMFVSSGLYLSFPTGQSLFFREASTDRWSIRATSGDFAASASGSTIAIQEATAGAACSGTLTANGTTPVVTSTTCATTGSRILLTKTSTSAVNGSCYRSALSNGVSFSITCLATDTGTYDWFIIHEAP